MKFLVMSDNHGRWALVHDIISRLRSEVDYIFHCGDSEFLIDDPIWKNVDAVVLGNMDYNAGFAPDKFIDTPVGKVFLTHGHYYYVNRDNQFIVETAKENQCRFAFHGHTHVLYATQQDGVIVCNPGSLNHSRGQYKGTTYMIVTIENSSVKCHYYDEQSQLIEELTTVIEVPA